MDINSITNLLLSSDNVDLNKLEKNKSYLYQYNKDKYCNIEQIVNAISQYHIKHHDGINPDPIVEFSVIGSNNTFTNVYDKPYYNIQNTKVFPVFSIITNFDDNACQLVLTNVDNDTYKYKDFDTQTDISVVSLAKYQNIAFNSNLYHGYNNLLNKSCSELSQTCLLINIWNNIKTDIPYFLPDNNCNYNDISINIDTSSCKPTINEYNGNVTEFFDDLLYQHVCDFKPENKINTSLYKIIFNDKSNIVKEEIEQSVSYNDSRWNNTFCYNMFPTWMCNWFITEFDNIREGKQDMLIDDIKTIHSNFTSFFPHIFQEILYFYSISKCSVHIYDGQICKLNDKSIINKTTDTNTNDLIIIICIKTSNLNNGYVLVNSNKYQMKDGYILAVHSKHDISYHNISGDEICMRIRVKINEPVK